MRRWGPGGWDDRVIDEEPPLNDVFVEDWTAFPATDPPAEPPQPARVVLTCQIQTPTEGSVRSGAWNGVTITVTGIAGVSEGPGSIARVEVQFDGGTPRQATPTVGWGPGGIAWTVEELITAPGPVRIVARAFHNGSQATAEHAITVTADLPPKPPEKDPEPPPDTTPPSVAILSPKANAAYVLDGQGNAEVEIAGWATDVGKGIEKVEVTVDGLPHDATAAEGGWSNWTAKVRISGVGHHEVTARAVDKTGQHSTATVQVLAVAEPLAPPAVERLLLVEKCRLSTYLGAYGAGRTIKTLSLLPGEKTKVAIKSYRRTSETATEASSIFDFYTDESQEEFEDQLSKEQANTRGSQQASSWNVQAEVGARWGWGSASVAGGATGSSNASREELAKNVATAVHKHAAKASAKRDVEIKSSREMKREEGEEFSSESEIENISVGRTLNFVFRQMNQEFITLLHLIDVRVAYVRGDLDDDGTLRWNYREVTLSQLDGLLRQVIVRERREDVRREIMTVLSNVFDYQDEPHAMVEERQLTDHRAESIPNGIFLRVPKGKTSTYADPTTGTQIEVPGVILAAMRNVMRTDGVICDAVLGQGEALDSYSQGLQDAAVEARKVENAGQRVAVKKEELAVRLVKDKDVEGAQVFKEVYPTPVDHGLALVTTGASNGSPT